MFSFHLRVDPLGFTTYLGRNHIWRQFSNICFSVNSWVFLSSLLEGEKNKAFQWNFLLKRFLKMYLLLHIWVFAWVNLHTSCLQCLWKPGTNISFLELGFLMSCHLVPWCCFFWAISPEYGTCHSTGAKHRSSLTLNTNAKFFLKELKSYVRPIPNIMSENPYLDLEIRDFEATISFPPLLLRREHANKTIET